MHIDETAELAREMAPGQHEADTPGWQFAVASGVAGWVLDAFDFFVIWCFCSNELAAKFQRGARSRDRLFADADADAMRPVGALLFGILADKFGRKRPLMACVLYFSTIYGADAGLRRTICSSWCCGRCMESGWAGTGGLERRMRWRVDAAAAARGVLGDDAGRVSVRVSVRGDSGCRRLCRGRGWAGRGCSWWARRWRLLIVLITLKAPESEAWKLHQESVGEQRCLRRCWAYKRIFGLHAGADVRNYLPERMARRICIRTF